jgi:hypothetical protein
MMNPSVLKKIALKIVAAYCQRNQLLPELLLESREWELVGRESVTLFPTLFAVAMHANQTAPTMLLTGLLTASDSIGINRTGPKSASVYVAAQPLR